MKRYNANISNELIRNRKSADGISKNLLSMTELRIVLTLISLIKSNTKSFTAFKMRKNHGQQISVDSGMFRMAVSN